MSYRHGDVFGVGRLDYDTDGIDDVGRYFIVPRTLIP